MKLAKLIIPAIILCLGLAACGTKPVEKVAVGDNPTESESEMSDLTPNQVITFDMNGKTIEVNEGDIIQVSIPTLPVEGFDWVPTDLDTSILEQMGPSILKQGTNDSSSDVILFFKAVGKGSASLSLIYSQDTKTNPNAMYTKSFGVTINVD
ncbi:MAG: protease inhibitor I42 family protein [Anaerolineaceae bacterium]|nr:protease inhibitor I42 family protein [Anaerolineaceae bacterium]